MSKLVRQYVKDGVPTPHSDMLNVSEKMYFRSKSPNPTTYCDSDVEMAEKGFARRNIPLYDRFVLGPCCGYARKFSTSQRAVSTLRQTASEPRSNARHEPGVNTDKSITTIELRAAFTYLPPAPVHTSSANAQPCASSPSRPSPLSSPAPALRTRSTRPRS